MSSGGLSPLNSPLPTPDDDAVDRLAAIVRAQHEAPAPIHPEYEIQCLLAQGGMGSVFLAIDRKLQRQVAMKVAEVQDAALLDRFHREAVGTANLQHPNILPVFDYGSLEDGRPFYTMELIEGQSLRHLIESLHASDDPRAGLPSLLRILSQVCEAVGYAHEQGAVHRDLKSDNIMVGAFNQVWVVDWGLAKLDVETAQRSSPAGATGSEIVGGERISVTLSGQVCGTPAYMAPEQARGLADRVTPLVDVYSAGAVLFEILTSRPPFAELSSDQVLDRLREGRAPSLSDGAFPIPGPLRSIINKATAPSPENRYQSAQLLASDLQRWMDGGPVLAHEETWFERLGRIGSRYGTAIAIIVFYLVMRVIILMTTGR